MSVAEKTDEVGEPTTYLQAVSCDDSVKWLITMNEEIKSLHWNRTWVLVKLPSNKKIVRCKWVFKKNESIPRVENARYKVRLVAKGYNQVQDVNFNKVF